MVKHELAMQKLRQVPHLWDGKIYIRFIMLRIDRTILFGAPRICIANNCHLIGMVLSIERFQNLYIEKRVVSPKQPKELVVILKISHPFARNVWIAGKSAWPPTVPMRIPPKKPAWRWEKNSQRGCFWFYWGLCHYPLLY